MPADLRRAGFLLLVDDEEAKRALLTRRLELEGYAVAVAEDGRRALEMMRVERFDLVLLDLYMPVMDGLATLDAIKSDPVLQDTAVVMLTAANTREHVVQCLSLGAADYLIKPINAGELMQRVRRCLQSVAPPTEPTVQVDLTETAGARVLVVDDEPSNRALLGMRLKQLGFRALSAPGGREALELLAHEAVDAVLLDVNMPGMNGVQVLQAIRRDARWRVLPVLMLSAEGDQQIIAGCYQYGANDYLTKPCHLPELRLRLGVALAIKAL